MRTSGGAATWETVDLQAVLGSSFVRIIAVDQNNPRGIYLRNQAASYEELVISDDGGTTLVMPVRIMGQLGGFAVLPSGTIVVGGVANVGTAKTGAAFHSRDGGLTFEPWPNPPRVRALAHRGGMLFVAGDNYNDGFALAVSTDEGTTLTPILRYEDVSAVKPCVRAACGTGCDYQVSISVWPASVCDAGRGRRRRADGRRPEGRRRPRLKPGRTGSRDGRRRRRDPTGRAFRRGRLRLRGSGPGFRPSGLGHCGVRAGVAPAAAALER